MFNPRKLGLATLVALLAIPAGAGAVYAASVAQQSTGQGVVAQSAHPVVAAAAAEPDTETADDNESKTGPDTDNIQEGPGSTAEGPDNEAPGQETPDKNEAPEAKK